MNKTKIATARARKSNSRDPNGANEPRRNGVAANGNWVRRQSNNLRDRKTDLGDAIQRYVDLFEFAPIGYISFNRAGRIEEINVAATNLLGWARPRLIGTPFALYVAQSDTQLFLQHLLNCRSSESRVETELHLKRVNGEKLNVILSSTPTSSVKKNGSILYQTAIVDLTERKAAEEALAEAVRQRLAVAEFVGRVHEAKSLDEIYAAGLDAISSALSCPRVAILLLNNESVMRFVAARGLSSRYRRAVEGHSPWRADTRNPAPIFVPDIERADFTRKLKSVIKAEAIHALAFIPLVAEKKLIGKLMLYYNAPHVFAENERSIAITIGRQLALGLIQHRAAKALRDSEARLRAMLEQATVGIAHADLNGQMIFVNQCLYEMLGYTESELIGKTISDITHPEDRRKTAELFKQLRRQGRPYDLEKRYVRKDGSILWVRVSASPVRDTSGEPRSAVGIVVDVTDRKKAEAALRRSKEMLETLVERRTRALRAANVELKNEIDRRKGLEGEILKVTDREQQRLGRELHDGLCQQLTGIGFMAQTAALRLKKHRVVDAEELEKIAKLVSDSAMEARMIARDLHKEQIEAAGFERALRNLTERKIWSTPCQLRLQTKIEIDNDKAASEIYRILREAITNANTHARATRIIVSARRHKRDLAISVEDDGVGLNGKGLTSDGLGFHIMKYRAKMIGARVKVESPHKGGTRVTIYLPDGAHSSDPSN